MRKFTARTALAMGLAAVAISGVGAVAAVAATSSGSTAATTGTTMAATTAGSGTTTTPAATPTHKCPGMTAPTKAS